MRIELKVTLPACKHRRFICTQRKQKVKFGECLDSYSLIRMAQWCQEAYLVLLDYLFGEKCHFGIKGKK